MDLHYPYGMRETAENVAERYGVSGEDQDAFALESQLNEAFASQALACIRELALDPARVNVNGAAIVLGHPPGASGARILATLLHELRRGGRYVLATMCIGDDQGIAAPVEAVV